jgi:hypothetical protein
MSTKPDLCKQSSPLEEEKQAINPEDVIRQPKSIKTLASKRIKKNKKRTSFARTSGSIL